MSDIFVNKSLFLINFLCCISAMSLVNKYEEKYYNQTIDHFSFFVNDLNINYFQQRYLIQGGVQKFQNSFLILIVNNSYLDYQLY